jgi:hypothetical protein
MAIGKYELKPLYSLYNSICHQLLTRADIEMDYKTLRKQTCDFMIVNENDYIFFLSSKDNEMMSHDEYVEYCHALRDTAVWGGQIEVNQSLRF